MYRSTPLTDSVTQSFNEHFVLALAGPAQGTEDSMQSHSILKHLTCAGRDADFFGQQHGKNATCEP